MKRLANGIELINNVSLKNKKLQMADIYEHKLLVFKACNAFAKYLFDNNQDKLALELLKRAANHDISKYEEDEFYGMASFVDDMDALKDPKKKVSDQKQVYINIHWDRNEHHPEYWTDINDMRDIDIMELSTDWYARSMQFNTNMLDFLKIRQKDRFHFPQDIYDKIEKYYYIIKEYMEKEED